ncbi:GNAT family N-acetyltransferase [Methanocrinis sp.]|uniref:GNAT family N-acetyltransferase n=1 Tax=Methanocrinis sp. TaxID=3101522 RepID=UPI003D0CBDC1
MDSKYRIRRAESLDDARKLRHHFTEIFRPEDVGDFAETIFLHFPGMKNERWFIAVEEETGEIAAAFALIPWTWEMAGTELKVAEMGIVGTGEAHRNKGLMRLLYREFDATLEEEGFDLAAVQGIPGFYRRFGYHYSIPLEPHIDIPLHLAPDLADDDSYEFRLAETGDIPFLLEEDERYRRSNFLSVFRDGAKWNYLLTFSPKIGCGSEFWIMEGRETEEKYYFRISRQGFGDGLIVSEISESISDDALTNLFAFCKKRCREQVKPYIRLNLSCESVAGKTAHSFGASVGRAYAWQIKIPDKTKFLEKIAPILEARLKESSFAGFSGILRLDFYKNQIDLNWSGGRIESVTSGSEEECPNTLFLSEDLFAPLVLGHRTWQELQHVRPDIFPATLYTGSGTDGASDKTARLIEILFPAERSWIYEQY